MAGAIEQELASLGINLHEAPSPIANYVGFVRTGNLLFVSGQVCFDSEGKLIAKGKLGGGVTVEQGQAAARGCGINLLAQVKAALGDLDKVVRVVRLGGFVDSAADFLDGPKGVQREFGLIGYVFGDKGRLVRTSESGPARAAACRVAGWWPESVWMGCPSWGEGAPQMADGAAGRPSRPARYSPGDRRNHPGRRASRSRGQFRHQM